MRTAEYNTDGLEVCPKCHERKYIRALTVDLAPSEAGHHYICVVKCKLCHIQFQFYQDEVGVSLHQAPRPPKAEVECEPAPSRNMLEERLANAGKRKRRRIKELSESVANELMEELKDAAMD